MAASSLSERQKRTFLLDSLRGAADGPLHAIAQSVALLVGIKLFAVPDSLAALISSAPFIGNFLSLFYSARFSVSRFTKATLAATPLAFCAASLLVTAWVRTPFTYALAVTASVVFFQLRLPFLSAIYHDNYAPARRGVLFARGLFFSIATSLAASAGFGRLLNLDLQWYRLIMVGCAATATASFFIIRQIPADPPRAEGRKNPFKNLGILLKDRIFGYILLVWFIFGFANLWITPLRIVYLAEPERGLDFSPFTVLLLYNICIESARLVFTPFWAKLFDRMNFVALRMMLNFFLGAGILTFFMTEEPAIIAFGSILSGVGFAGGRIAWNLWVTRFAPASETHVYMSVHTFLTGVRGFIGPYIGFLFVNAYSIQTIAIVSSLLVLLSILMLIPALKHGRRDGGATLVP